MIDRSTDVHAVLCTCLHACDGQSLQAPKLGNPDRLFFARCACLHNKLHDLYPIILYAPTQRSTAGQSISIEGKRR